ncbi:unnamed protein product [Closterium sp. NIES-64]|nr:unnamed protein product [Closterium sp. NIES-64]
MSRMTTRNGGVRNTDALTGNALDKPKEVSAVVDTAASSAVKRTSDLFTEADKDALQPGVSAQRVQDAARSLLGSAASGATSPPTDGVDKPEPADGAGGNNVSQEKRQATTAVLPTDDDEEDDGYLSDDPEERYDASAKREVAQRVRFAIVLLIPLVFKPEVTRVQTTLRALFALWKKELKFEIQGETKFQELSVITDLTRLILKDLSVVLISTGVNHEEWICVQECYEKANGATFAQAAEHVVSQRHSDGVLAGFASRASKAGVALQGAKKEFGLRLLAVYFPAQAPPRGSFLGSEFSFFAADLPKGEQLVVAGDFNMIEDPVLDKSNLAHRRIPKGITDHKSGVCVRLVWRGAQEPGPGVWRFPSRLAKRPGVKAAVAEVVQRHEAEGGADFDKLSRRLGARLRKYDKEERGRVKRTRQTLERQVSALQQKVMADPSDDELQAVLTSREAMLERYWDSRRDFLQTRTGLKVQLNGEAPTALLSAMVKSRKARTGIKELVRNGVSHTEAKEILAAATGHFAEAFGEQSGNDGAEPVLDWTLRRAQVYPPDDLLWRRVDKLVENFVSGNHTDTEKHFRLWSGGLIYAPRELGGLGEIDPRRRIDSVALRCTGLTLLQECSLRRGLAERAAGMPLGWATLYAHKAVLKGGLIQSRRWARICKAVLKSTAVEVKETASRWEAAEEFLCFNKRIIHRGNAPFGGQQGTEKLRKWKMRDMVLRKWDGTVVVKSKETLARELGGDKEAEMALKAFAAAPEQWRKWLTAPLTADEVAAASSVVCPMLPGG